MTDHKADEKVIARFAQTRDPGLREEAILCFIPLVHYVLGRLGFKANSEMDHDDLLSQGVVGLIEAVDNYDLSYGTKFSTYAVPRIRGKILDYLRTRDWLPRSARNRVKAVQRAMHDLRNQYQRSPTDEEIAQHLGLKLAEVHQALTYANLVIVSLDSFVPWLEEDGETYDEFIPGDEKQDPANLYDEKSLKQRLGKAIRRLDEREQLILSLYYHEELTMREIGEVLGISESRICQLHARSILEIKAIIQEESRGQFTGIKREQEAVKHV